MTTLVFQFSSVICRALVSGPCLMTRVEYLAICWLIGCWLQPSLPQLWPFDSPLVHTGLIPSVLFITHDSNTKKKKRKKKFIYQWYMATVCLFHGLIWHIGCQMLMIDYFCSLHVILEGHFTLWRVVGLMKNLVRHHWNLASDSMSFKWSYYQISQQIFDKSYLDLKFLICSEILLVARQECCPATWKIS